MYSGIVARAMHGADLSWIVGLMVTSPVYYFAARWTQAGSVVPAAAPASYRG
jgi:NCS1 family nucleobase:cation symporter-1